MEQTNDNNEKRNETLAELSKMHEHFSKVQSKYDEIDQINEMLPKLNRIGKIPMLVFGCIALTIAIILTVVVCVNFSGFYDYNNGMLSLYCYMFYMAGIGLIVGFIIFNNVRKKRIQNYNDRLEQLAGELMFHYNSYGECPLGVEYSNPKTIERIYDMVQRGEADTIQEAVKQFY